MTQSSMHLPPLRHGRRARHTEAVDTGGVECHLPLPSPTQRFHLKEWLCCPLEVEHPGFDFQD